MKNIMVAVDADQRSGVLINHAVELAKKFDAKIWIVHIANPQVRYAGVGVAAGVVPPPHKAEQEMLQTYEANVKNDGLEAEGILINGPTIEMVLEEAAKIHAELIVIGSHEHSFIHNALLGTTTGQVIKKIRYSCAGHTHSVKILSDS